MGARVKRAFMETMILHMATEAVRPRQSEGTPAHLLFGHVIPPDSVKRPMNTVRAWA